VRREDEARGVADGGRQRLDGRAHVARVRVDEQIVCVPVVDVGDLDVVDGLGQIGRRRQRDLVALIASRPDRDRVAGDRGPARRRDVEPVLGGAQVGQLEPPF
jgi:hypothetical protein